MPSLRPSGDATGRPERQAQHAPAAAGVDRVEQDGAQAPVADPDLEQRVEPAQGVGLDGLAPPSAGVDGGAKARVGAAHGVEERGAAEGSVAQPARRRTSWRPGSPCGCGCRRGCAASNEGRLRS